MVKNGVMGKDVNLTELASLTKNYTGSEIEGVVKAASSYVFFRAVNMKNFDENPVINADDKVSRSISFNLDDFI